MRAVELGDPTGLRVEIAALSSASGTERNAWRQGARPDLNLEELHLHAAAADPETVQPWRLAAQASARGLFGFVRKSRPAAELAMDDGALRALERLDLGQAKAAAERMAGLEASPDLRFLWALALLQQGQVREARGALEMLDSQGETGQLGRWCAEAGVDARFFLACDGGELRGGPGACSHALLAALCSQALGEARQERKWWGLAAMHSQDRCDDAPLLLLGWLERALRDEGYGERAWLQVEQASRQVSANLSQSHAELLLVRGQALHYLDMLPEALGCLTKVVGKTAGRHVETILEGRYDRALVYLLLNRRARAREDWKAILRVRRDYRDVLGMLLDQMGDVAGKAAWMRKRALASQEADAAGRQPQAAAG